MALSGLKMVCVSGLVRANDVESFKKYWEETCDNTSLLGLTDMIKLVIYNNYTSGYFYDKMIVWYNKILNSDEKSRDHYLNEISNKEGSSLDIYLKNKKRIENIKKIL